MGQLTDRVALVTGASSGIGRAVALGYAGEGAAVALVARRERLLKDEVRAIERGGGRALALPADVADEGQVAAAVEAALEALGRIDILFNNAGVLQRAAALHRTSVGEWDRVMGVNLRGAFLMLRAVVPHMVARRYGRVINISSYFQAEPQYGAYSATKAGINSLTRTMAAEVKGSGVLVNAIDPGWVRSGMSPRGGADPVTVVPLAVRLAAQTAPRPNGEVLKVGNPEIG
jgi:3-oxoacyl-[acyl-carrier protein] reductase